MNQRIKALADAIHGLTMADLLELNTHTNALIDIGVAARRLTPELELNEKELAVAKSIRSPRGASGRVEAIRMFRERTGCIAG